MKRLLVIVSLGVLSACSKKNRLPGDILPPQKMQAILWDLMRADQFMGTFVLNKDTSKNITIESLKYYAHIFSIHDVEREEFQKSFSYYRTRPELFKTIMDSISTPSKTDGLDVIPPQRVITPVQTGN